MLSIMNLLVKASLFTVFASALPWEGPAPTDGAGCAHQVNTHPPLPTKQAIARPELFKRDSSDSSLVTCGFSDSCNDTPETLFRSYI
jgi:hypothetical protein